MKIAALIARILLGLIFVIFGLNGFLNFLHAPLPTGVAGQFIIAMASTHYLYAVSAFEVIGGGLLLSGVFVPLGLTILGPLLVNILLFHICMLRMGLSVALVTTALWFIVFAYRRSAFAGIF